MEGTHGASTSHGSDAKTSPPENAEGQIVGGPKSSDEVPSDMPKFVPKFRKRQVSVYVTAHQTDKVWLNGAPAVVEDDRNVDGKVQVKIRLKSTKETVWVPEERLKVAKSVREQVLHDWGFPHVVENVAEPLAERMIKLTPPEGWPLGLQEGLSRVNERGEQIQEENKSGRIGDCWFLSSLSVLASKPQQVRNLLLSSNDDMKTGQFLVRIAETGKWKTLVVDDLFPVDPQAGVLAFCGSTSNELWVSVIEKAYAKAHGGYKNIEGGMASWALHELTGCPVKQLRLDQLSFGEAWERLQACKKDECLMCVSTKFLQDKDNGLYKVANALPYTA
eukprot:jgi/Bigna1/136579/aug1.34_g11287